MKLIRAPLCSWIGVWLLAQCLGNLYSRYIYIFLVPSLPKDGQFTLRDVKSRSRAHSCQKTHDHQVCHCQKLDSLEAQASMKRGGSGGVAPHQLSHGVDICAILSNDEVPQSPSPVVCPCHYRVICILTDLEAVSMSTSCVVLACCVDPHRCWGPI